jgi:hypothetical protein
MPLFYFHLKVGRNRYPDHLGVEFDSLEAAYLDAFEAARDMWSELLKSREDPTAHSFEICNADGELLLTLPFTEVLEPVRRSLPPSQIVLRARRRLKAMRTLTAALNQQIEQTRHLIEMTQQTLHRSSRQQKIYGEG